MKSIFGKLTRALCLAALLVTLPASAAVDMFLDLGSSYAGESQDSTYAGKIDALAWSWGMSNSSTLHFSDSPSPGTNSFQNLTLTKYVDKASPKLMLACASRSRIPTGKLIVRRAGATAQNKYLEITLTDVLVTSVTTGGSGGEDRFTENIILNFAKVQFDYYPVSANGVVGPVVQFKWDIPGNRSF